MCKENKPRVLVLPVIPVPKKGEVSPEGTNRQVSVHPLSFASVPSRQHEWTNGDGLSDWPAECSNENWRPSKRCGYTTSAQEPQDQTVRCREP